jgi:hypothetical protein
MITPIRAPRRDLFLIVDHRKKAAGRFALFPSGVPLFPRCYPG